MTLERGREGHPGTDLGLTPSTEGNLIRIPIPALSEERRRELVKVVHKFAEEGRMAIRHARTETHVQDQENRARLRRRPEASREGRAEDHDEHLKAVDAVIHAKEAEIMEV